MSNESKKDYLLKIRPRYLKAAKKYKEKILDEFRTFRGNNRKYAIRKLNAKDLRKHRYEYRKCGPMKKYYHPDIEKILKTIWIKTNLPCSIRLIVIFHIGLPHYPYLMIKEHKNHLLSDRTSCSSFQSNQFGLFMHSIAYIMMCAFR